MRLFSRCGVGQHVGVLAQAQGRLSEAVVPSSKKEPLQSASLSHCGPRFLPLLRYPQGPTALKASSELGVLPASLLPRPHRISCLPTSNNPSLLTSPLDQFLDLSANALTGSLPLSLGALVNVAHVNISFNQLQGSIPADIMTLTALEVLDLSSNLLTVGIDRRTW